MPDPQRPPALPPIGYTSFYPDPLQSQVAPPPLAMRPPGTDVGPSPPVGIADEPGNIDLQHRPNVRNRDGSHSSVRSLGVNIDGREVLIPTVADEGRVMSDDDAVKQYRHSGRHLGKFSTPEDSTAYARRLHLDQEANMRHRPLKPPAAPFYGGTPMPGVEHADDYYERDPPPSAPGTTMANTMGGTTAADSHAGKVFIDRIEDNGTAVLLDGDGDNYKKIDMPARKGWKEGQWIDRAQLRKPRAPGKRRAIP